MRRITRATSTRLYDILIIVCETCNFQVSAVSEKALVAAFHEHHLYREWQKQQRG